MIMDLGTITTTGFKPKMNLLEDGKRPNNILLQPDALVLVGLKAISNPHPDQVRNKFAPSGQCFKTSKQRLVKLRIKHGSASSKVVHDLKNMLIPSQHKLPQKRPLMDPETDFKTDTLQQPWVALETMLQSRQQTPRYAFRNISLQSLSKQASQETNINACIKKSYNAQPRSK